MQAWIRLFYLPQEYRRLKVLFELACGFGTPVSLYDETTKTRTFGHYAKILGDLDLTSILYDEIIMEGKGFAFCVGIVYERLSDIFL